MASGFATGEMLLSGAPSRGSHRPAPSQGGSWGAPQTLTEHIEPRGGLGSARCPRPHQAHVVPLVAHLGLSQHQTPPGVQLVWGAAAPGVVHLVLELSAMQLGRGQAVADPRAVGLWAGERLSWGLPASPALPPRCPFLSAAPWVSASRSLSLSGPSVPLSTPPPPAPCLLSHFPLSGSLFLHLTLFPPVSLYLPVSPHSFLFLFSSTPQALAFWVSASKCPLSRASALKGDFFILASAVPAHQGTLERAFPLLGLHFPTCKMERQLGGASRGLWALMRE